MRGTTVGFALIGTAMLGIVLWLVGIWTMDHRWTLTGLVIMMPFLVTLAFAIRRGRN